MKITQSKWFSATLAVIFTFILWILFHIVRYGFTSWRMVFDLILNTAIIFGEFIFLFFFFKYLIDFLNRKIYKP